MATASLSSCIASAQVLHTAAVSSPRHPTTATATTPRLPFSGRPAPIGNVSLNLGPRHGALAPRASKPGDSARELASEKAVESNQEVASDAAQLAGSRESAAALDARAEDASDAASFSGDVRASVVDVASDTAVDTTADVGALARKDARGVAKELGRTVEDAAEALEAKAAQVSDREARKES